MGRVVPADGKTTRRRAGGVLRSQRTFVLVNVAGGPQLSVGMNGQHRDTSTLIIGSKNVTAGRVDTDVGWPGAFRTDGIEKIQMAGGWVNRVGTDCARAFALIIANFITGIQMGSVGTKSEPGGVPWIVGYFALGQRSGCGVHFKNINALPTPGVPFRPCWRTIGPGAEQARLARTRCRASSFIPAVGATGQSRARQC